MSKPRQLLARWGETLAAERLVAQGYTILAQNVRTPYGEIDIVARDLAFIVFVEVKTRSSTTYGQPEEAVTARKRAHLLASAQHYLQTHPELEGGWRIDVIAIRRQPPAPLEFVHFENAIGRD